MTLNGQLLLFTVPGKEVTKEFEARAAGTVLPRDSIARVPEARFGSGSSPGGSVSMHAAIAGLLHYRCNGQAYKTSRRAGVLESLNVMVREAKTAVVGMEACRRWPCLMPSTLLPFEANHAQ